MKKKIVFYAHSLVVGGIEKSLLTLLKELESDYNITLILEKKEGLYLKELPKSIKVEIYNISTNKNIFSRKIINRFKLITSIIKNYHKYDFSCAYIPYSIPGSILMRYYAKNNCYFLHSDYYQLYKNDQEETKKFFNSKKISKYKKVLIVSQEAKDNLLKIYPKLKDKVLVCGNLIDYSKIIKLSQDKVKEKKPEKSLFINVARHEEAAKKITRLINAFAILAKEKIDFELWLIGQGEATQTYKELVKKLKLTKQVKFLGLKDNPYPYYKMADAFILSSDYEGFPGVYLESLIFSLPIITTIPVSNHYFSINDYALVSKKDEVDLVKNIKEFLEKPKKINEFNYVDYNQKTKDLLINLIEDVQ